MSERLSKTMSDAWFEHVPANASLTQGDIIPDCPVIGWSDQPLSTNESDAMRSLTAAMQALSAEVIVMTQACDLEQRNVDKVILCPCFFLTDYRLLWEEVRRARGKKTGNEAFDNFCRSVKNGTVWNLTLLNHTGTDGNPASDHRFIDFHTVYTSPLTFLESLVAGREDERLRLRSPYREHLSQSFARFFMRVGLPVAVTGL